MKKRTIIVSDYRSNYEWINTEQHYSIFLLKIKYFFKGAQVFEFPSIRLANLIFKLTGKRTYKGTNMRFEYHIKGSDQITYYTPYHY